ncbi:hypothetical protein B0A53_04789 [Rhodotorula sp. CCFEE 5036]|nr:hypothetical protein B0A53_04789 [Rhodotorula sp. CCFEE 5036]
MSARATTPSDPPCSEVREKKRDDHDNAGPTDYLPTADKTGAPPPSTSQTSESAGAGETTDDDEDEEVAAEEEAINEEEADDRAQHPEGVTGLLSGILRWRQHHQKPSPGAEAAAQSPLDPLATTVDSRYLPIISGLACPFSVLLEIPGLTEPWYVKTYGYTVIETRPNPVLLDVGLAISLTLGVVANVCLVARFLEFRPKRFTLFAILALTLHDVINIAAVSWFGISKRHADGFNYNDTFWMTVASTVASTVCNVTLIVDLVRTRDFARKGSGLTERQRALMVTAMFLFLYLGLGALFYFYLIPDLRFVDALFFVEVTIFTVGFGDPVPVTPGAKTFTVFYASFGIVAFALTVAVTRETILETFEVTYRARRARLAQKARERKELYLRRLRTEFERRQTHASSSASTGAPAASEQEHATPIRFGLSRYPTSRSEDPKKTTGLRKRIRHWFGRHQTGGGESVGEAGAALTRRPSNLSLTSSNAVEASYRSLKQQVSREEQQEFRTKLGISVFFFIVFWLGGAGVFVASEKWTYGNAVWFAFETFSTIGYGDFIPYTPAGRAFFIPWSIVGVGNMTLLFSILSEGWSSRYKSNLQAGRVRRLLRQRMLFLKQAPKKSMKSEKTDVLARLLDSEGYRSVAEEPVPPEELPKKVADTVRAFHAHARYFMLGRSGDPPPQLRTLLDAVDDLDTQLDPIFAAKASALAESTAGRDTKHYLFMLAYEREFDRVIASAGQLSNVIESAEKELLALKEENDLLQAELRQLRPPVSTMNDSPPTDKETGSANFPRLPSAPRTPTLSFVTPSVFEVV